MDIYDKILSVNIEHKESIKASDVYTVIIADDHPVVRKSLRSEIENEIDFRVVAEACDGEE